MALQYSICFGNKVAKIPKSTTNCDCEEKLVQRHDEISILQLGRLYSPLTRYETYIEKHFEKKK